jgi:hypothetical protein
MSHDDDTPVIPQGHVPSGEPYDGTTPKYLAGFRAAVKRMMGPQPHQWVERYSEAAKIEQLLQRAYQQGLLDGHALAVPLAAPGPVNDEPEVPRLSLEEVWADLGLFVPAGEPPRIGQILATVEPLEPLTDDPYVWAVQQTRTRLGLSLVEADDIVKEILT